MGEDAKGGARYASAGGMSGVHPAAGPTQFRVGTSTADQFNTAHLGLIPVACWCVDDIRFAFDSSFITATSSDPSADDPDDIRAELRHLSDLVKAHPDCPLSVFGHADPVGSDDYNKLLSGRRAMAVYALLIVRSDPGTAVSLWQQIAGTEHWGADQRNQMRAALPDQSSGTSDSSLFQSYMQKLCPPDLNLGKKDFLAQGADSGGKGDFQGCGEFNPLLVFSQEKQAKFDQAKQQDDKVLLDNRDSQNAPNRRVLVLIFRKGSRVVPSKWPCPRVNEGVGGCIKRFWSDGETRRSTHLSRIDRNFVNTHDTFACRFFQRISEQSPCHHVRETFRIRLYDLDERFIADAPYEITVAAKKPYSGQADHDGIVTIGDVDAPAKCLIRWGFKPESGQDPELLFSLDMFLTITDHDENQEAAEKLNNLGYYHSDLKENVRDFQSDYGDMENPPITPNGELDGKTMSLLRQVYGDCADDLKKTRVK
jgi:hypothetical protein